MGLVGQLLLASKRESVVNGPPFDVYHEGLLLHTDRTQTDTWSPPGFDPG